MKRLPTLYEILKKHNNSSVFTIIRADGSEVFAHPLSAAKVREGIDKQFLGCCVSEITSENFLDTDFITVTLRV